MRFFARRWERLGWVCSVVLVVACGVAAAQQAAEARIEIDAAKVENRVSPRLYGHFAEFMFENVKGGMWAELVRNRSFEEPANAIGLSRYWEREPDDRNDDVNARYGWDASVSYPPQRSGREHALRLQLAAKDGHRHGVSQPRMPVRAGIEYHAYVWIKTEANFEGEVTIALEQDRTEGERYAGATQAISAGEWRKYEFTLRPERPDPLAKFVILLNGKGRAWVDQASLMPGDAVGGVRRDVYEKIAALRPGFIRWPGGNVAQDYHWTWGVGPRDQRVTWSNLSWWNEPEPSDFGTHEFLAFCRGLKAEPHLVVNVEGRGATAAEAAAWVEYVNGPSSSKHGALRVNNGAPEPFGVSTWEIGNEIWGDWVRGHSDAATYARNYLRYTAAMRKVDPRIEFIAVGDNDMNWNRTVVKAAGRQMDYLAIHHYYGLGEMQGDPLNLMARPLHYEQFYRQLGQMLRELVPGRKIKLIINEWNTSLPLPRQHSMESALYAARLMNVFERSGDLVEMTAVSDLVNGWPGGIIQASRHDVFVTPTYHVIRMYNDHLGTERLAARVSGPTFDSTREGKDVPYLDAVASRSFDGKRIFVKAVNTNPDAALRTTISLAGAQVRGHAEMTVLTAPALHTANTFRMPGAVAPRGTTIPAGASFTIELPKHSVAVIALEVQ